MNIIIRNADIVTDIQGIREVHKSDDHWGSDEACLASTLSSLENGFFIQVAVCDGKIVGHTEWVISDESLHRFLYLSLMQVHDDYQGMGVGTKLTESGVKYAVDNGCSFLRTMPNVESGSLTFYEKNGFVRTNVSNSTLKIATTANLAPNAAHIDRVPFDVIKTLPLKVGLYQYSSAHIWKVYNTTHEHNRRTVSSFIIGGAYINIGAFGPTERASAACWSDELTLALIADILAVGGSLGYKYINFCVLTEAVPCFAGLDYELSDEHDVFMERCLYPERCVSN